MKRTLLICILLAASSLVSADVLTISGNKVEYKTRYINFFIKENHQNIGVQVQLVDGRLPNEIELEAVSREVQLKHYVHKKRFIYFYLTEMTDKENYFATDNYLPNPEGIVFHKI